MGTFVGDTEATDQHVGDTQVAETLLGSTVVWQKAPAF